MKIFNLKMLITFIQLQEETIFSLNKNYVYEVFFFSETKQKENYQTVNVLKVVGSRIRSIL